ncbi:hypothetical protein [Marmoricola sp. URHB0036]|uniref:hypothetical protein n=1 Tax=Marmoricola sp. URHB0036 TaxID=1298863 RepID=UPI0012DF3CDB|nr:hypothetical protein [Marmoricola sp. URHB0036]
MGRHTGERVRAAETTPRPPKRQIVALSLFVTITLVAWGVLVLAAIDFGRDARSGDSTAWTFLGLASVGAAACLFVTMILGAKLVGVVRARTATPPPTRLPGGRRAARRTTSVGRRT